MVVVQITAKRGLIVVVALRHMVATLAREGQEPALVGRVGDLCSHKRVPESRVRNYVTYARGCQGPGSPG